MTIKVTYNVTDVYVSETISATYINISYEAPMGASAVWGAITGTLSNQTDLQTALDLKVPYTGATANVDLGEFEMKAGQVEFDQTPTGTAGVGVMRWNDSDGTVDLGLKGGNVTLQVGQEQILRVVNKTGADLLESQYRAVRIRLASEGGTQGQRLAVVLAQGNNDANSADTIGIVTETITNNQEGFICTSGLVRDINTTGSLQSETWADGDIIYLSPTIAGAITNIKPTAPNHSVILGYVVYAHNVNGKIFVKCDNGYELGELHDVNTTGATNGQVLKYNGTIWTPSSDAGITTLTTTGTSGASTLVGTTLNIPQYQGVLTNPITGTGTSGQVAYFTGATTQAGSNNLVWDNSGIRLGIGRTPTARRLELQVGNGSIASALSIFDGGGSLNSIIGIDTVTTADLQIANVTGIRFYTGSVLGNVVTMPTNERMRLYSATGNLALGGTFAADSGQRLQVTGDTLLKGSGNTSATTALTVQNSAAATMMSISNDAATTILNITGSTASAFQVNQTTANRSAYFATASTGVEFGCGTAITNYQFINGAGFGLIRLNTAPIPTTGGNLLEVPRAGAPFQPTSGTATFTTLSIQPTINQTGGANGITRGLYVNPTLTAAADWRSIEWSNNSGWGLYGAGTAPSYFGGNIGIGTTGLSSTNLRITKNITGLSVSSGIVHSGTVQSDVTTVAAYFQSLASTQAASFSTEIKHYAAQQGTFGAGSTVSVQYGFEANSTLIGATNNYGFFGNIASGTGRWNLYMNGTAANFLSGDTQIGTGALTSEKLQVNGTMKVTGASSFGGNMGLRLDQNADTKLSITNNTSGLSARARLDLSTNVSSGNIFTFGFNSASTTPYKILNSGDGFIYYNALNDIAILNDYIGGSIKMAAGGSSTAHLTIASTGKVLYAAATTAKAQINLASGTAPTTPVDGDIWFDGTDLKMRIGGVTKTFTLI